MTECVHHLEICDQCGGLSVVRLDEIPGITGFTITLTDGREIKSGPDPKVFMGPAATPCEAQSQPH